MSGADLANLVNEAALIAGKRGMPALTPAMLDEAMDKAVMGGERKCAPRLMGGGCACYTGARHAGKATDKVWAMTASATAFLAVG